MDELQLRKQPRDTSRDAFYNRFAVQAKLEAEQYYALIKYCKKEDLNINKFIKLSISFFLSKHD